MPGSWICKLLSYEPTAGATSSSTLEVRLGAGKLSKLIERFNPFMQFQARTT